MQSSISLIPVIELEPSAFQRKQRDTPTNIQASKEWATYSKQCYQDSGLFDLTPFSPTSWLFAIEHLSTDNLKIILKQMYEGAINPDMSFKEILNDSIEYAPFFAGGFILIIDEVLLSKPGCCCGLESIVEWQSLITESQEGEIWTGHDKTGIVHAEKKNTMIKLIVDETTFSISVAAYTAALSKATQLVDTFIQRNGLLLNELFNIQKGPMLSKAMIYK